MRLGFVVVIALGAVAWNPLRTSRSSRRSLRHDDLVVFILLCVKYSEVAIRYPGGGGVVTVATRAIHPFAGLVGGLLILVDYFLTAALSALSRVIYLTVVAGPLKPLVLVVTSPARWS